jgi:uncharacterized protein
MFNRILEAHLEDIRGKYRAITIAGPRQSGKTTLCRKFFPEHAYRSLENPQIRLRASEDPQGFLQSIEGNVILDEIQNAPDLLSYLQEILDDPHDTRQFILTGSNSLQLSGSISQSLAGRTRILTLLPLSYPEIPAPFKTHIWTLLQTGQYPRVHHEGLSPENWYADYFQTYITKDVRSLLAVENLDHFIRFIRLAAGRVGQLVNHSSLASDAGITSPTAARWLSVLNASFITFTLQPHFKNFSKRITKAPKIYFYDTGLLCYLLRISSPGQLEDHPLRGFIFENWVIAEHFKACFNQGKEAPLYFWRDQHGHEVDLVIDEGTRLSFIEIKSSATFHEEYLTNLTWLSKLQGNEEGTLIYTGNESFPYKSYQVRSWREFESGG